MTGIYFSGTGNTKYCVETLLHWLEPDAVCYPIGDRRALQKIKEEKDILFGYPIYYSSLPKIVSDFLEQTAPFWKGKRVFLVATMGLFSGDGCGLAARRITKYGAKVTGGLHLKMPDCIGDVKALKKPLAKNKELVWKASHKMKNAAGAIQKGKPPQEGLGPFCHLAGLFGQRLYFYNKTKTYTDKLKINKNLCVGCGTCARLCPMENLSLQKGKASAGRSCTMCYRCISHCPTRAITLLGKEVFEQSRIERYL